VKALVVASVLAALAPACTSNPTPHPGQDAARSDDTYPGFAESDALDMGPDDDNNGVADCVELNGSWDGDTCVVAAPVGDAGDASDGGETVDGGVPVGDASDDHGGADGLGDAP